MNVANTPRPDLGDRLELALKGRFDKGQETLVVPTPEQFESYKAVVGDTEAALKTGDGDALARASRAAQALDCELVPQDGCLMLREQMGKERGWGTVVFNVHPQSGLVVEVPHPLFDWGTPELGWQAFRAFNADVYVVAGAHRGNRTEPSPDVPAEEQHGSNESSTYDPWHHAANVPDYSISDPSHSSVLPFEAAHEALVHAGSTVLQVHGFNAQTHHAVDPSFPADQQVVLTHCADDHCNPPLETAMADALTKAGYKTEMVDFSDDAHSQLGAVVNVQHAWMVKQGLVGPDKPTTFVHMEVDRSLRLDGARAEQYPKLMAALAPVFDTAR